MPKSGGLLCPFPWRGAGSPYNTMWPGPRPVSIPSDILIHPTVWPQYTDVADGHDRQTMVIALLQWQEFATRLMAVFFDMPPRRQCRWRILVRVKARVVNRYPDSH